MIEELQKEKDLDNVDEDDLNIPTEEPKSQFDPLVFEGKRVKITNIHRDLVDTHFVPVYNEQGRQVGTDWNENETVKQHIVKIETEVINPENKDFPVTVTHRFNLQTRKDDNGKEIVYISKHPKAFLWKFMRKMGAVELKELKDKYVTLTTEPDKNDPSRHWLRIVV